MCWVQGSDLYPNLPLLRPSLPRFQGIQGLSSLVYPSLEEFNPCEVEGHLQLETIKFPLKKKKKEEKIFFDLEIVGGFFSLEDWLIISFREGGFLTQQMDAGQPDH